MLTAYLIYMSNLVLQILLYNKQFNVNYNF